MDEGLVIVAHGSHLNPNASDPAYAHADRIREVDAFREVRECFWKEEPSPREVLRTLITEDIYVVPLFISEGYFTETVIPRELRLQHWEGWDSDGTTAEYVTLSASDVDATIRYTGPVGTHPSMADVIVERAESVTGTASVGSNTGLAVVGHGTDRNPNSAKAIRKHAAAIGDRHRFSTVRALFMDEEPRVDALIDHFDVRDIVVVPLFIADGYHTREDIPRDIGISEVDTSTGNIAEFDNPTRIAGHRIWYAGAVGTEPRLADVILQRAEDAGAAVRTARNRLQTMVGDPERGAPR